MSLHFDAQLQNRHFDVSFSLHEGETLAILGRNGAGKSTVLSLIAGLLTADSGHAELDGQTLFSRGQGSHRATFVPPHARAVALLAQDALLFPHLTVLNNVAFGPRSTGARASRALDVARHWLTEVDAREFEARRPGELSGGQAQRVAVARALAAEPHLLLLDEPLAALDISVAPALRSMLRRVLVGRTAIIVTHDVLDAFTLADRVIVIDNGRIVEEGPTRSVLEQPRDPFTASITGLNILTGLRTETGLALFTGEHVLLGDAGSPLPGTECTAAIRPAHIRVSLSRPGGAVGFAGASDVAGAVNALRATVHDIEPRGDLVRVRSALLAADVTPATIADLDLTIGRKVWFSFLPNRASLYPTAR